jgi:hypothetical protein
MLPQKRRGLRLGPKRATWQAAPRLLISSPGGRRSGALGAGTALTNREEAADCHGRRLESQPGQPRLSSMKSHGTLRTANGPGQHPATQVHPVDAGCKAGDPTFFFHTEDRATLAQWTLLLAKRKGKAPAGTTFR